MSNAEHLLYDGVAVEAEDNSRFVGEQETMGFWSQNHFTLIPRSLKSMNAGRPTQPE